MWDGNVHDTLAHCGLLKFMRIPLMKSLCLLLQTLVRFWDIGEEAFLFHDQCIEITLVDVYFLTGLPMLGFVGDLAPMLSLGKTLEGRHWRSYVTSTVMLLRMCMAPIS